MEQTKLKPEHEKDADILIKQAIDFLFEEVNAQALIDMAKASDPVSAIVNMTLKLVRGQYDAARMAKKELEAIPVVFAGREIAKIMAHILVLGKVIPPEQAESVAAEAFKIGIEQHNQQAGGA